MNSLRPVLYSALALVSAIAATVYGLMKIEGKSFMDALWLAVTSISTVGFGDEVPSTQAGRIIVMALIFSGVGLFTYLLSSIFVGVMEGHIRDAWGKRKMLKAIGKLKDHIVVCGAGRVGRAVINELMAGKRDFVVIEKDPDRLEELQELSSVGGVLFIAGDATEDRVLLSSGVVRARSVITTLADDAGNLMITIACKDFNPAARVVARANRPESVIRLKRAGADTVVCPSAIAGNRMALASLKPASVAFVQTLVEEREIDLELEELIIGEHSPIAGKELKDSRLREEYGVMLLAIKRGEQNIINPDPAEKFQPGDVLILSGPSDRLTVLERVMAGGAK
ncbi:MAG: potassium channel protein [Firmicutes bacterium]|nr:potassium channel protein [Bacillota bacterium]